jgi:hypothetical protein
MARAEGEEKGLPGGYWGSRHPRPLFEPTRRGAGVLPVQWLRAYPGLERMTASPSHASLSGAVSSGDPAAAAGERPSAPRRTMQISAFALAALGIAAWVTLATWRLASVPGMSLDEAWSILSARGQWPADNPLSGMTSYSGPFPVLLLRLLGTANGLWILRGTSVLLNGAALILINGVLGRAQPGRGALWFVPLIATLPVWLVVLRTGIEVVMFTPFLFVLGLYWLMLGKRWSAFGGALAWGLLVYNHLVGVCFPLAAALAWLITYRRAPTIPFRPALLGAIVGLAPRVLALILYHDKPLAGTAARYSLLEALGDLRWLPLCLWRTWQGDAVYLRYVGRLAIEPWPYCLLGAMFFIPWVRQPRSLPKPAWFTLLMASMAAVLVTLVAPYMAVRFFPLPLLGLTAFLVLSGGAAVDKDARWRWPVGAAALGMTLFNVYYCINDFYRPWQSRALGYTQFFFGDRSKRTGNWAYYPKDQLVRELLALSPTPEQIVASPTLERPLRVLLDGLPLRVALPANADANARSVFVDYRYAGLGDPHCINLGERWTCFRNPTPIGEFYVVYVENDRSTSIEALPRP